MIGRRVFLLCHVFAAIVAGARRLRIDPPPPEPRHLYAVRSDGRFDPIRRTSEPDAFRVYVSTSRERAMQAYLNDGYGFHPERDVELRDVTEIPDGTLIRYRDTHGVTLEEPAALIARNSPLVDVCVFPREVTA